ncbi:uncharacterized protein LOC114364627 [Ostrinia furnacalis]|uniref:uncharacterized protein LOC114364627 n=1 Tax=Ostrinia furnacalis TaxID=93504 RepID=UPI00103B926F|nr:uncharacterized protein LOC114364627 [Ostrinia furnacalis]
MSLLDLPIEVLLQILYDLELTDLHNLMLTCKTARNIVISNNSIWRNIIKCWNQMIVRNSTDNSKINTLSIYNQLRISNNWRKGIYKNKVIIQHNTKYMPWLYFHNSQLILLSVGSELHCYEVDRRGTLRGAAPIWKFKVPTVKRGDIRTNDISRFVRSENIIFCGNRDGSSTVALLTHPKKRPKPLYFISNCQESGKVEVSAVELVANSEKVCAITASMHSSKLLLWNFNNETYYDEITSWTDPSENPSKFLTEIEFPEDIGIRCLSLHSSKRKIAAGLNRSVIPVLIDIETRKFLYKPLLGRCHKLLTRDIRWHDPNTIIYVTNYGTVHYVDVRAKRVVHEMMDPFQASCYCLKSDGDRAIIVGSSEYSRCVLYDIRKHDSHVQMYFTQKKSSPVYSLDFDSTKLIAAVDRSVAVLDYNTSYRGIRGVRDYSHTFEVIK